MDASIWVKDLPTIPLMPEREIIRLDMILIMMEDR